MRSGDLPPAWVEPFGHRTFLPKLNVARSLPRRLLAKTPLPITFLGEHHVRTRLFFGARHTLPLRSSRNGGGNPGPGHRRRSGIAEHTESEWAVVSQHPRRRPGRRASHYAGGR